MDREQFLSTMTSLAADGYKPFFLNEKAIRLERAGVCFCPLGAVCDYHERTTIRGLAARLMRKLTVRIKFSRRLFGRAYYNVYTAQLIEDSGASGNARTWATWLFGMDWADTDTIVRAADAWDENEQTRYDRPMREAMMLK